MVSVKGTFNGVISKIEDIPSPLKKLHARLLLEHCLFT
jgi:hypothetical protein